MKKCAKCDSRAKEGSLITQGGEVFSFCNFCSLMLDKFPSAMVQLFLEPDASQNAQLCLTPLERNILRAKELRKQGKGPWSKK